MQSLVTSFANKAINNDAIVTLSNTDGRGFVQCIVQVLLVVDEIAEYMLNEKRTAGASMIKEMKVIFKAAYQ